VGGGKKSKNLSRFSTTIDSGIEIKQYIRNLKLHLERRWLAYVLSNLIRRFLCLRTIGGTKYPPPWKTGGEIREIINDSTVHCRIVFKI